MSTPAAPTSVLENLVRRSQSLYTLPSVAMRVLELTSAPRVDIRSLKECIENDPALTTRILRVVNSSLFGLTRKVTDLNQALALLGAKPLKLLVLGFSLPKELLSDVESAVLKHYWGHTLVKAVAAREISERLFKLSGDEVFIAGLLQDVGLLVLVQDLGEAYCQFLQRVLTARGDLAALELETLGFDHTILSARLLESWALPESIVMAIGTAFDTGSIESLPAPHQAAAKILHLAEMVTRVVREEVGGVLPALLELGRRYCNLTPEQLDELVADLDKKVPQLAEILSIPLNGPVQFVRILADAHEQLAGLVTTLTESLQRNDAAEMSWEDWDTKRQFDELLAEPRKPPSARSSPNNASPRVVTTRVVTTGPTSAGNTAIKGTNVAARRGVAEAASSFDVGLVARVESAVAECRGERAPLSLIVVELDRFESLLSRNGPDAAQRLFDQFGQIMRALVEDSACFQQVAECRFAYLLKGYDRSSGVEFARRCVQSVRGWSNTVLDRVGGPLTLSVGLAALHLPPKNFPATDLIAAAIRCLSGAQLSGGDTVKSIDMY